MITTKTIKQFVELYTTTQLTTYDIAKMFNCSPNTVLRYLKQQGVNIYPIKRIKQYKKYYKDKYMIALYDMNDNLFVLFDNCHQMSNFLGKTYNDIYRKLSPKYLNKKLRYKGQWYKKVLISVD